MVVRERLAGDKSPTVKFLLQQQKMTEQVLFECGCGRTYTSYPAFSTHKKQKHGNQAPAGTKLPRHFQPKRGRPAFTLPNTNPTRPTPVYSGLTTVELGLLGMEERYPNLLSQPQVEPFLDPLNQYDGMEGEERQKELVEAIRKFNEIVLTHVREEYSVSITVFLQTVTLFLLKESGLQLMDGGRISAGLFNLFFTNRTHQLQVRQWAKEVNVDMHFYLRLTVVLSGYLAKIGVTESTLRLPDRITN